MHFIAPIYPPPPKFFFLSLNNVLASGSSIIEHDFVTFCTLQWNLSQWLFDIRLCLRWWPSQRENCRGINSLYVFTRVEGGWGFSLCVSRFLLKFFFFLHFYYLKKKKCFGFRVFCPFQALTKTAFSILPSLQPLNVKTHTIFSLFTRNHCDWYWKFKTC